MAINVGDLVVGLRADIGTLREDLGKANQVSQREMRRLASDVRKQSKDARDSIDLLGDAIGVRLPRELKKVIAQSQLIGPGLVAAFRIGVVVAFAAALVELGPKIAALSLELGGFTKGMQEFEKAAIAANRALLAGFGTTALGEQFLNQTNQQIEALEKFKERMEDIRGASNAAAGERLAAFLKLRQIDVALRGDDGKGGLLKLQAEQQERLTELRKKDTEELKKQGEAAGRVAAQLAKQLSQFAAKDALIALQELVALLASFPALTSDLFRLGARPSSLFGAGFQKDMADLVKATTDSILANWDKLKEKAKDVFTSTRTPLEAFNSEMVELNELLASGLIGWDTYARAVAQAKDELAAMTPELREIQFAAAAAARTITSGFIEAIVRGGSFREVLAGILQDLARIILQLAFRPVEKFLTGLFGSIFGGIFGGGRQHGGLVSPSQAFLVGEAGPELFVPPGAGKIVPSHQLGGGVTYIVNAPGADAGSEQRIRKALEFTYLRAKRDAIIQVEDRQLRRGS